ncbi:MAG: energy-coupling factor transporter transmembrane component T [Nanoarchaeota archaeon]|nr:energy-coupling factor transporter transmembrane component T [Nanoarchaeota archaeon]
MDNFLKSMDPRTKLLGVLLLSALLFVKPLSFQIFSTLLVAFLWNTANLSLSQLFRALKPMSFFFAFLFFAYVFLGNLAEGILQIWRFSLLIWIAHLLVSTTSTGKLVLAVERLTRPILGRRARTLGILLSLTIRFIPLLQSESETVRDAMKSRCLRKWKPRHFGLFIERMLGKSIERVGRIGDAFISRGYRDQGTTSYHSLSFRSLDYGILVFLAVLLWI